MVLQPLCHAVIDHQQPLSTGLKAAGGGKVDYVAALTSTGQHLDQNIESLQPQGALGVIDDGPLDVMKLATKSISLQWELMFTRSPFETPDVGVQGR